MKTLGKLLLIFGAINWGICLFYLYGYTFDHISPAHPDGLIGVGFVGFVAFMVAIMLEIDEGE